jgi:cytochrome c peroxidase
MRRPRDDFQLLYMHDGVFKTIEEAVNLLDKGRGTNLSTLIKPLGLTAAGKTDLLAS